VAVAAPCFGHSSAVITSVGNDGFGEYVRSALHVVGVVDRYVGTDPVPRTPLVFPEIYSPDNFALLFYRGPRADPVFQDALRTRFIENWCKVVQTGEH
jgi:5-dehydro-2-deoxygluconokinase